MKILKVEITKVEGTGRLLAFATVETDCLKIWDVKVLSKGEGMIVSLPTKKKIKNGKVEFHPYIRFNSECWDILSNAVLEAYDKVE